MSKENVLKFRELANKNIDVQEQLRAVSGNADVVAIAKQHGLEFTQSEFQGVVNECLQEQEELSDIELEFVAGGGGGGATDPYC